jgi:dsDNA-specific endonuclease/ATPase MutS2
MWTLGREIMIGSYSKHSRKFFFDDLTKFIKTLGHYQK